MPIVTERIAKGVYCNHWQGHVTADDAVKAFETETQMAAEDGVEKRVSIIDGAEIRTFPMNVMKLSKIVSPNVIRTIVYQVPRTARTVGELVGAIAKTGVEFTDDWDETVARALQIIAEESSLNV